MKLRLLTENEFDFLDTDEPVQDGEDKFDDYDRVEYELLCFVEMLNGDHPQAQVPIRPRHSKNEITYWHGNYYPDEVTEKVRSHPLYVKDRMKHKRISRGNWQPSYTITTNLEYDGLLGQAVWNERFSRWNDDWTKP